MTKTFKELQNGELFVADNDAEIIFNRGDGVPIFDYRRFNYHSHSPQLVFQKRDEFGGNILYHVYYGYDVMTQAFTLGLNPTIR